jgi:putative ABC transport system permease protein
MRSLLSILLIAVPVTLILTLVGLTQGMLADAQKPPARRRSRHYHSRLAGESADQRQRHHHSGRNGGPGQRQPHVKLAMGVINDRVEVIMLLTGIDMAKFNQMTGGFTFDQGRPAAGSRRHSGGPAVRRRAPSAGGPDHRAWSITTGAWQA